MVAAVNYTKSKGWCAVRTLQEPRTEETEYIKWLYRKDGGYYTPETFKDAPPRRLRMLQFLKEACYESK